MVEANATIAHGQWTAFVEGQLPFGIRTAQMYVEIGEAFASNTQDLARLPAHFTLLHALAKVKLKDADTWARVAPLVFPDITLQELNDLVDPIRPVPEPPTLEAAAPPARGTPKEKTKSKALIEAERTIGSLHREIARERETLRALTLEGIFVRSSVTCSLCTHEYWLEDPRAQEDITAWITRHLAEAHADDDVCVRYVLERYLPPVPEILTDDQKAEVRKVFSLDVRDTRNSRYDPRGFGEWFAQKMLGPVPAEVRHSRPDDAER
jgi:hypothetical protein